MLTDVQRTQIKDFLIGLARKKSTTGYLKLNEKLKLGLDFSSEEQMNRLYDALDDISRQSYKDDKVFLGIVVVNKMRNRPGPRFYKGVEAILGTSLGDTDDFFERERERLYVHYSPT